MRCFYWPAYTMKLGAIVALILLWIAANGHAKAADAMVCFDQPQTEATQLDDTLCVTGDDDSGYVETTCPAIVPDMPSDWEAEEAGTCDPSTCSTPFGTCDPCPPDTCCWIKYCGTLGCMRACWVC